MPAILRCRRSVLALVGMFCLLTLGLVNKVDVAMAIAGIVASVAAANSFQAVKQPQQKEGE